MTITKRNDKGSALTYDEMDDNFDAIAPRTSATGSIQIPAGATNERDLSPQSGYLRYNTSLNSFEGYGNGSWGGIGSGGVGGGDVNQNAWSIISVAGQASVASDNATDTLELIAGSGISITTDAGADSITINASLAQDFAYSSLTGIPTSFPPSAHNQAWSTITNTPTTLAGYGITDGGGGGGGAQGVQGFIGSSGLPGDQGSPGPQGTTGTGINGVQGPQGTPGSNGFQGTTGTGINGVQGVQGTLGSNGFQGTTGTGTQGLQGPAGSVAEGSGTQGTTGIQGVQGLTGATGFGTVGNQGIQGVEGSGTQGPVGDIGDFGPQGIQGSAGSGQDVQGVQGLQGALGFDGQPGFQGMQGPAGSVQGLQGIQGDDGPPGFGLQGIQGTDGIQGSGGTGPQGVQGVQGLPSDLQGVQGLDGEGVQGTQGLIGAGAQGAVGFQGVPGQGQDGAQGVQGNSFQGLTGFDGLQGIQGLDGDIGGQGTQGLIGFGTQGIQGTSGAAGATGEAGLATQGIQGLAGEGIQGFNGFGDQGLQGTQGTQGVQGELGLQGTSGDGNQGAQGTNGIQGAGGIQGSLGIQGIQGTNGIQGIQGTNGIQGNRGLQGIQGTQSIQGTLGFQGLQGIIGNTGPGLGNIVEDTTPQLGGALDLNGFEITNAGNIILNSTDNVGYVGINNTISTGGKLVLNNNQTGFPSASATNWSYITVNRASSADVSIRWHEGTDKWQFTNDGSTYYDFVTADTNTGILNVVEDLTPQLGGDLDVNSKKITAIGTYGEIPIEVNINSVATELVKFGYDPVNPTSPVAARYGTTFTDKVWIDANSAQQFDLYDVVTNTADITSDAGIYMNFIATDGISAYQTRASLYHQNNMLRITSHDKDDVSPQANYLQLTLRPIMTSAGLNLTSVVDSVATSYDVVTEFNAEAIIGAKADYFSNPVSFAPKTTTQRDALTGMADGDMIWNITTDKINTYDGSAWTEVGGGGGASALTIDTKSAAYTVVDGDLGKIINFSSGSSADATLPDITTVSSGFHVSIWNTAGTGVSISVKPIVGQQIGTSSGNGFTNTQPFVLRWGAGITLVSDGTYWHIYDAKIYGNYRGTIAIGSNTTASNNLSIAIGNNVTADGVYSMAIGTSTSSTQANANYSTAIGVNSGGNGSVTATGSGAMALGGSRASGVDSFAAAIANNTATYGATALSSVAIGALAKASGSYSVALGYQAQASNSHSHASGYYALASGAGSFAHGYIASLASATASGAGAVAFGPGSLADKQGKYAFSSDSYWSNGTSGTAQYGLMVLRRFTSDATPGPLVSTSNNNASTTNQIILPNSSAYSFSGTIVARQKASDGTASAAWEIKGLIRREANAASTVLVNSALIVLDNTPAWGLALTADTTNGGLKIEVTGAAATNIRWVATINTSEVTYV